MKRLLTLMLGIIILLALTACGKSDLEAYTQALDLTQSYDTGVAEAAYGLELTFNEEGLSAQEQRDLSYYENIELATDVTYDYGGADPQMIMDTYFNFGGLGFDVVFLMDGDRQLVRVPILDKYMDVSDHENEEMSDENQALSAAEEAFLVLWKGILEEEDVVSSRRAYIMTERGQIKTTTYEISLNADQFERLKDETLTLTLERNLIDIFVEQAQAYSEIPLNRDELEKAMTDFLGMIELEQFHGTAYVDFDGRLVRQSINYTLKNNDPGPGQVAQIVGVYEVQYDRLGQPVAIELPQVSPEDMLDGGDGGDFRTFFPRGLF